MASDSSTGFYDPCSGIKEKIFTENLDFKFNTMLKVEPLIDPATESKSEPLEKKVLTSIVTNTDKINKLSAIKSECDNFNDFKKEVSCQEKYSAKSEFKDINITNNHIKKEVKRVIPEAHKRQEENLENNESPYKTYTIASTIEMKVLIEPKLELLEKEFSALHHEVEITDDCLKLESENSGVSNRVIDNRNLDSELTANEFILNDTDKHGSYLFNNQLSRTSTNRALKQCESKKLFKCGNCTYRTTKKKYLMYHIKMHMEPEDTNTFQCYHCSYKTIRKTNLKQHLIINHMNFKDINMFQCGQCPYKTERKINLKIHLINHHMSSEDVDIFQCSQCSYRTHRKYNLTAHMSIHMKPEDIEMFQCGMCSFRTRHKSSLKAHMKIHMKPEDIEMFQCNMCSYKSNRKGNLNIHMTTHLKPEDIKWFPCNECSYKAKGKFLLKKHLRIHVNPEDMLQCDLCCYKAKRNETLNRHIMRIHKKSKDSN